MKWICNFLVIAFAMLAMLAMLAVLITAPVFAEDIPELAYEVDGEGALSWIRSNMSGLKKISGSCFPGLMIHRAIIVRARFLSSMGIW